MFLYSSVKRYSNSQHENSVFILSSSVKSDANSEQKK